jgi:hypothetical protein
MLTPDFIDPGAAFSLGVLIVGAWLAIEAKCKRAGTTYISWDCRDGKHLECEADGGCTGCPTCRPTS